MTETLAAGVLFYLEVSLLIAAGYVVLRVARWLAEAEMFGLDWSGATRLGRAVFLAVLLAPLAAHLVLTGSEAVSAYRTAVPPPVVVEDQPAPSSLSAGPGWGVEPLERETTWLSGWLTPDGIRLGLTGAVIAWIVGLVATAAVTARRVVRLRALVRDSVLLRRSGRLRIVVSDKTCVPFSTSICGAAHVVLPVALLRHPADTRIVLSHELQHYRNRDPRWTIGLELFRLFFFWHPAAWLWVRDLTHLQELACDEAIVRRGTPVRDYGTCLIRVASMAADERMVASTAMATASERGARLERRIDMLFDHARRKDPTTRGRKPAGILGAVTVLAVLAVAQVTAISWPTASDLQVVESTEAVEILRTLAMANDVEVSSVVANDETGAAVVELDGQARDVQTLLKSAVEEVEISQVKLEKCDTGENGDDVHAAVVLEGPIAASKITAVLDSGMDIFERDAVSAIRFEVERDSVTLYTQNHDDDCLTDLDAGGVVHAAPPADLSAPRREAPDFEFHNLDGSTVRLSHLEGKVVLVDFWAAWCPHCTNEVQHLKKLDRELGGAEFEIVGVSLSSDREEFQQFIAEHEVPWAQLHTEDGWKSAPVQAFDIKAVPSHVLVDRDGNYTRVPHGNPDALTAAVRAMIAEGRVGG